MTIGDVRVKFDAAMTDADNLVEMHSDLGKLHVAPGAAARRGRRTRERALNHAIVVLTVAAWQAFCEDALKAMIAALEPPPGDAGVPQYRVMKALALNIAHKFSTPNAENTQSLFLTMGFDPWPHWKWTVGRQTLSTTQVRERMNQWLRVRHKVAHGEALPDVEVLSETKAGRSLRRGDAENCMTFFRRVVDHTVPAIDGYLK